MYLRGGKFNLPMRTDEVLLLIYGQLGITRSSVAPIPPNFKCDPVEVDGVTVFIKPSSGVRSHRIFVKCACGKDVPAGRLAQHLKFRRCFQKQKAAQAAAVKPSELPDDVVDANVGFASRFD